MRAPLKFILLDITTHPGCWLLTTRMTFSFNSPSRPHFFGLCGLLRCLCSVLGLLSLALSRCCGLCPSCFLPGEGFLFLFCLLSCGLLCCLFSAGFLNVVIQQPGGLNDNRSFASKKSMSCLRTSISNATKLAKDLKLKTFQ